jgi:6-phosphogluconolactonase (cycloisomerase 2 family)
VWAINGAVADNQSAACWLAVTKNGRYAFVSNAASNTISSYYVSAKGQLTLVHEIAASTDKGPHDIIVAKNNLYVYEINIGNSIGAFYRTALGGLQFIGSISGLPPGSAGIVSN